MSEPAADVFTTPKQAGSLTRIADGVNEAELLELAYHATAAQVEKLVSAYRCVVGRADCLAEREQASSRHAARDIEAFRRQSIDAADWIIPAGALDLDFAISGLIQSGERNSSTIK